MLCFRFFLYLCFKFRDDMRKAIAVFCSAAQQIDKKYFEEAAAVGRWMADNDVSLVYGGAEMGLMEEIAKSVKQHGGHVVGVVPTKLRERGAVSQLIDDIIYCNNLSERKDIMLEQSDLLVALPGGIGTLDEVFHIMGAATIGYHHKKVVLYNVEGFWDACIDMLKKMSTEGFIRGNLNDFLRVASKPEELARILEEETY